MKEIFSPSSKAKANRYGKSHRFSSEVPALFPGSLSEIPLRFIPAITCLTKHRDERINVTTNPIGDQDSKLTPFDNMSKNTFAWDGLQNLSPGDGSLNTLDSLLAMRRSINGSTRRPPISFCPWCEPIVSVNTEAIPENIKSPIFQKGSQSKRGLQLFLSASRSAIGKRTPLAVAKATRRCKSPWSAKPDMPSWPNSTPKRHGPWVLLWFEDLVAIQPNLGYPLLTTMDLRMQSICAPIKFLEHVLTFVNRSTVTSAVQLKIPSAWSDASCQRRPIWLRSHKFICQRSNIGSITVRENVSDLKLRRKFSRPGVALNGWIQDWFRIEVFYFEGKPRKLNYSLL